MTSPALFVPKHGVMHHYLVDRDGGYSFLLTDRVVLVDIVYFDQRTFARDFKQIQPKADMSRTLAGMVRTAMTYGITPWACEELKRLLRRTDIKVSRGDWLKALELGTAKVAKWRQLGLEQEKKDMAQQAAPRKLAGAALASKLKKEARDLEALEQQRKAAEGTAAKQAAKEATKELEAAEKAGAADVRLPKKVRTPKKKLEAEVAKKVDATARRTRMDKHDMGNLMREDGTYKSASAAFKGELLDNAKREDPWTDKQIFEAVKRHGFPLSDDKITYVGWNRRWLIKHGFLKETK